MASSSPNRRSDDSDDEDYSRLMSNVTPVTTPARKRNADHLDTSDDPLPPLDMALLRVNGNHLGAITNFATRKRLRPEQVTAVETFARDPIAVQLGKIFATCLANENALAKFQAAKPTFEINSALKTNITRAVNAMLCSSNISQYRGETGKNDVQALLSRHRWGNFVVGTEHDQAAMGIVQKFIAEVFTQSRSIIKKELVKSVENPRTKNGGQKHVPSLRPKAAHTTIYQLTKTIVQKLSGGKTISIPITPALCARVAMMRKWHVKKIEGTLKADNDDFWELVDDDLQEIRKSARSDNTTDPKLIARRVAKAFSFILEKDRKRHGSNPDEEIPAATTTTDDAAISYQADIDEALDARNQGQGLSTAAEREGEQIESEAGAPAEAPEAEIDV
ncbi:hypothetical protein GGX14DRAFT_626844 [Mycena pura]|uniref:Uncharacterized protein n=1 Tax=Mycena pura TaxID=153505 RepID=A0AAD6YQL2_9AGAR|nr:hypothetical protein GGX14DRAFT_580723 [Mycena pura]KAJ7223044.1 hypothetical protein GGX14DRAFT_656965 [Mycena pura]KAJ7226714.1 hypothetical protein GGX14DRAFT_626844 [Mycena pura]